MQSSMVRLSELHTACQQLLLLQPGAMPSQLIWAGAMM